MVGHKEHREHKEEGEKGFEERIKESLREQVGWLYPRLEYHLLANHLLANAKALVFAGTYFLTQSRGGAEEVGRTWLEKGLEIYRKELPEQVLADGVHFERSPMYHCIILEDLLDCFELTREPIFREYAEKMLGALEMLTGPDGKIAKFNDATEGIAKTPEELFAFAESLGIHSQPLEAIAKPCCGCISAKCTCEGAGESASFGAFHGNAPTGKRGFAIAALTSTSASGFVRQEAGPWTLLAKCGEIGPSYQPGHAHADTWSFELWKGGRKVIGDTGCSTYVPGPVRSYERSTAAHNTVVIDGQNSSEVWAAHRVGRRFDFGRHRRRFELTAEGLKGVDEVFGSGEHELEVRFHLPPGVEEKDVKIACDGERRVEPCEFATRWNRREAGRCVVYHQTVRLPAMFTWSVS